MQDDYYMLFNDDKSPYQPVFLEGTLSAYPGDEQDRYEYDFPRDVPQIVQERIYLNFDKTQPLRFDYSKKHGHLVSPAVLEVLKGLRLAPHYQKSLTVYMKGKATEHDYTYLAFDAGSWVKGVQQNPERVFVDKAHSETQLDRDGRPLPTGYIALTAEAKKYDVFELINIACIAHYMVCNAETRAKLEAVGIKGVRFVPLQQAFAFYLKEVRRKELNDLLG